jgi:GDPmannose 4,6-dehydratase
LAELLLGKGYEVHGIVRRSSTSNFNRIVHIQNLLTIHSADLGDQGSLSRIVRDVLPDEVYNLAAQSFVGSSWDQPLATSEMTGLGTTRILEAIRAVRHKKPIRFYQASSSEMFGKAAEIPQSEKTPFHPRSPYGVAKLYAHWITINYRESYDLFAVSGILYNHESPRRGLEFVTRKISNAVARIKLGKQDKLCLGNLEAKRDWGFAGDYVRAMWLILQHNEPRDFVVATGQTWTVKEFVERAFDRVGLDWQKYVEIDPKFMRPAEVDLLLGDATLARQKLGWVPEVDFDQLVGLMVKADLEQEK